MTELAIRRAAATDQVRLRLLIGTLTAEDLRRRFPTPGWTANLNDLLRNDQRAAAVVAVAETDLIGHACYERQPGLDRADVKVMVDPNWRHRGVGTELVRGLLEPARAGGIAWFDANVLADDLPGITLLHRLGFRYVGGGEGVQVWTLRLDPGLAGGSAEAPDA